MDIPSLVMGIISGILLSASIDHNSFALGMIAIVVSWVSGCYSGLSGDDEQ